MLGKEIYRLLIYLIAINVAFGLANLTFFHKFWMDGKAHPSLLIAVNLAAILSFFLTKQNQVTLRTQVPQFFYKLLEYFFFLIFLVLIYWYAVNSVNYHKESITLFFFFSFALTFLLGVLLNRVLRKSMAAEAKFSTLLIGQGDMTQKVIQEVKNNQWLGFKIDKVINQFPQNNSSLEQILNQNKINHVFIDLDSVSFTSPIQESLRTIAESKLIKCFAFSSTLGSNLHAGSYFLIGTTQVAPIFKYPLDNNLNKAIKRIFDILFSLLVFVFLFSWLFPIIIIGLLIDSGLPIFFKQKRHGMDNRVFDCYKFRTMVINKDSNDRITIKNDPRITKFGAILRKTSLDELPQFWNVLKGDMSIVGPRPHMVNQNNHYNNIISKYNFRHYVKPGITGLAQVDGFRGEIKTTKDMENRIQSDIHYIRNWSFGLDLSIIYRTVANMVKGDENAI